MPIAGRTWVRVSRFMDLAVIIEKLNDSDGLVRKRCILIGFDQDARVKFGSKGFLLKMNFVHKF